MVKDYSHTVHSFNKDLIKEFMIKSSIKLSALVVLIACAQSFAFIDIHMIKNAYPVDSLKGISEDRRPEVVLMPGKFTDVNGKSFQFDIIDSVNVIDSNWIYEITINQQIDNSLRINIVYERNDLLAQIVNDTAEIEGWKMYCNDYHCESLSSDNISSIVKVIDVKRFCKLTNFRNESDFKVSLKDIKYIRAYEKSSSSPWIFGTLILIFLPVVLLLIVK